MCSVPLQWLANHPRPRAISRRGCRPRPARRAAPPGPQTAAPPHPIMPARARSRIASSYHGRLPASGTQRSPPATPAGAARQSFRGTGSSCRGEVEEQLDHRQLAHRMTDRLLDGPPQPVPRCGMGTLIAAQGGRSLLGRHEPRPRRYPPQPAGADETAGISQQIPVPLGALTEPADDHDAVRSGPLHDLQAHEPGLARAAPRVLQHQHTLAENPPQAMAEQRDRRPDHSPRP